MGTSNSIDYSLTARDIIAFAYRKIGKVPEDGDVTAPQLSRGMIELNLMLKEWMRYEQIWRLHEGYVQLLASTAAYSLTPRPYRIYDLRYRDADDRDIQMIEMNRVQYFALPDKASTGIPTQWFFDPQRNTDAIYVWPVLSTVTTETIRVTYQRRYEDVDTPNDEVDVPQQYLSLVGYNLASRIADALEIEGKRIDRVLARAETLLQEMLDDDREPFIQLIPEMRDYGC